MKRKCDVCKRKLAGPILSLGNQPLCDDLHSINSNRKTKLYKIELKLCKNCLTVNQLHKVDQQILFPKKYNYRASLTVDVQKGMEDLCTKANKLIKKKKKTVLDIGCNDGSLLNFFKKQNFKTYGIEPTNAFKDCSKNHVIYNQYLNETIVKKILKKNKHIDIVTFTNVFAHIPNFNQLIKSLKILTSKISYLIIENHYLGSVLEKNQFDTFYQEHPRTYSLNSFVKVSKLLNLHIQKVEFPKRYGGNIRVYMSKNKLKKNRKLELLLKKEKKFISMFSKLKKKMILWSQNKTKLFQNLKEKKTTIFGKAFPGRASILINILGLDSDYIKCIFEQNKSPKNFHYVPGTKIPILPDREMKNILKKNKNAILINFSWHISHEIRKYLKKLGIKNTIIDIVEKNDFKKNKIF